MNEVWKVREAEYFLARLRVAEAARDDDVVAFELSAFLSAARSALLYSLEEARLRNRTQWYETAISGRKPLQFLAAERNTNTHWQPVSPIRTESVPPAPGDEALGSTVAYYFLEWDGTETAVELCEQFLSGVREVLASGQQEGILTQLEATFLSPVQLQVKRARAQQVQAESQRRITTR